MSRSLPLVRLHRFHPAIYAVPVALAAFTVYYVHKSLASQEATTSYSSGLHRSNARRRRRSRAASPQAPRASLEFLDDPVSNEEVIGRHVFDFEDGHSTITPLSRASLQNFDAGFDPSHSADFRECQSQIQDTFLSLYLHQHLMHRTLDDQQQEQVVQSLEQNGFVRERVQHFLALNQRAELGQVVLNWIAHEQRRGRPFDDIVTAPGSQARFQRSPPHTPEIAATEGDSLSHASSESEGAAEEDQQESKNLLTLLYAMAQDKHRREGIVHRGVTCNWLVTSQFQFSMCILATRGFLR